MPINPYDDAIASLAKDGALSIAQPTGTEQEDITSGPAVVGTVDPYEEAIKAEQQIQKKEIQNSLYAGVHENPDDAAKYIQLAEKTRLPVDVVKRQYDKLVKIDAQKEFDYDSVIKETPAFAKYMQDPGQASVSHDDVAALQEVEKTHQDWTLMQAMMGSLNTGLSNMNASIARAPGLLASAALLPGNILAKAIGSPELQTKTPDWLLNNPVAKFYDKLGESTKPPELDSSITKEISNGNYSRAARILAAQFVANAPNQAVIIGTTLAGGGAAGLAFAGITSAAGTLKESTETGADPTQATANALLSGTIEGTFERLGTFGLLKHWEGAIAKQYGKEVSKQIFKDFGKTIAYSVAGEANEEALTSIGQDFSSYLTGVTDTISFEGVAQRAVDAGILGGVSGGLMTGPSAISAGALRGQRAKQAALAKDFYLNIGGAAAQTKTGERMPEFQAKFIDQATNNASVNISAEAFSSYFQSQKLDPVKVAQDLGASQSYSEAVQTGGEIEIPLSQWINGMAKTEHYAALANDVRLNSAPSSVNQAIQEQSEIRTELEQQAALANESQVESQINDVVKQAESQLREAGLDPKQAEIFRGIGVLAQREGLDPMEFYQSLGLNIGRGENLTQQEQVFNQDEKPLDEQAVAPIQSLYKDAIPEVSELEQLRARVQELETELRTSPVTGLRNNRAFTEDESLGWKATAAIDMDGLKRLNDAVGHEAADKVLKELGGALLKAQSDTVRFYHRSGDEFAARFQNAEDAEAFMADLQNRLESIDVEVKVNDKTYVYQGIGISFGTGENYEQADQKTNKQKQERLASGKREDARAAGAPRRLLEIARDQIGGQSVSEVSQQKLRIFDQASESDINDASNYVGMQVGPLIAPLNSSPDLMGRYIEQVKQEVLKAPRQTVSLDVNLASDNLRPIDNGRRPTRRQQKNEIVLGKLGDTYVILDGNHRLLSAKENGTKNIKATIIELPDTHTPLLDGAEKGFGTLPPEAISKELAQGDSDAPRGQIRFGNARIDINLLEKADASTFFHETGHLYLEVLKNLAAREGSTEQTKQDLKSLLDWFGIDSADNISTEHHEMFARGFEKFIGEGKAPTKALRKAFNRFKLWILSVYQDLNRLNVNLTDDVRDVMTRMLATESEIQGAEVSMKQEPLFVDPTSVGMSDAQAARYIEAREEARQASEEILTKRVMDDARKKKSAEYEARAREVRAGLEAQVNKSNVYNAISILQKGVRADGSALPEGTPQLKLERSLIDKELAKQLPRGIFDKETGVPPGVAAEALGFRSAEEFLQSLAQAPDKEALLDQETAKEMAEIFPDVLNDGTISDEAIKAVHNDSRAKLLRMELEHLASNNLPVLKDVIRKTVRRVPRETAVREQAAQIIGSKKVSDTKPYLYQRAEIKAAKEAGELLAKGDIDGAFLAKRRELLNHELYRAAVEANLKVNNFKTKIKKIFRSNEDVSKTRDIDMVNAARAVLSEYGLAPRSAKTADEYLKQLKQYDEDTYNTVKVLIDSALEEAANYNSVSNDQFSDMADSVEALWDLAKTTKEVEVDGKRMSSEEIKAELKDQIDVISKPQEKKKYSSTASDWEKTKMKLLGFKAALTRVEHWADAMDVEKRGPFTRYIWEPVSEAVTKYRLQKADTLKKFETILRGHAKNITPQPIDAAEIGHTFKNKTELLMALLHTGNESNQSKLIRGWNWGTVAEDGTVDMTQWNSFVERAQREGILTKADYDFAQQIWDLMESLKPGAQKAHKQMYGYYFNEITAKEIETPFGNYQGGYIPAKVDIYSTEDGRIRQERETFEKNNNSWQFPTTGRGFTKSRVDAYAAPLSLDLNLLGGHIDSVLRFTTIEPRVKEVSRIVLDKSFRAKLSDVDSQIASEMLVPWLQRSAQQQVVLPSASGEDKLVDAMARFLRKSAAMQIMVGNVTNTLQQFTGLAVAMTKVKPKYIRNGLVNYIRNIKGTTQDVLEKSAFMRSTQGNTVYETQQAIKEIVVNPTTFENMQAFASKHTYFLQSATQNIVNTVVWSGAYEQEIARGASELEAVKAADSAVRATQGTQNPEDISRFETGTATKRMFTQFAGYFNMIANLNAAEIQKIARDVGLKKGAGRLFYVYIMGFMLPAVLADIIVRAMSGKIDEDDDEEYMDEMLSSFFGSQFRTATAFVPYVGQLANAVVNRFNDKTYDDRVSLAPAVSVLEGAIGTVSNVYKKIAEDADNDKRVIKDALTLIGLASSLPVGPLGKPAGYLVDVSEGNIEPSGPIDFTRGLITGRGSN